MGYSDYLRALLRPMGVYRLEQSINGAELDALGMGMDACCEPVDSLKAECVIPTAEDFGLHNYETLFPNVPAWVDTATRRAAIMALLQIDNCSFTLEELNRTLAGCGIDARVEEADERFTVRLSFPGVRGTPGNLDALKERIEEILPCHIAAEYAFVYVTWAELHGLNWADIERMGLDWDGLEKYSGD